MLAAIVLAACVLHLCAAHRGAHSGTTCYTVQAAHGQDAQEPHNGARCDAIHGTSLVDAERAGVGTKWPPAGMRIVVGASSALDAPLYCIVRN